MKAEKLLESMTLDEKIGQITQTYSGSILRYNPVTKEPHTDSLKLDDEERTRIGSILNYSICDGATIMLNKFLSDEIGGRIPLIAMHDVIHGCDTIFPISLGLACSFDAELVSECSYVAGKEAAAHNISVVFAPMADLARDPRWGRVMETTGEDPYLNGIMAAAVVKGFHKAGISTCVKHFAAYGQVEAGREYSPMQVGERNLREYFLPAYKAAIDAGADMVMTSYSALNDIPCTGHKWLLKDILRDEWEYDGLIISDSSSIREMTNHGYAKDWKEAAWRAMDASVDIEMQSACYIRHMKELIEEGKVTEKQVDEACLRVLKMKESMGLLDGKVEYFSSEQTADMILKQEYLDCAKKAAEKSAVLLKNDGVLPFSDKIEKIAVIGPFADTEEILGNWICFGKEQYGKGIIKTVKEAVADRVPNCRIEYVQACGWDLDAKEVDIQSALDVAKDADAVVLCLGEYQLHSGEACSRVNIELPEVQMKLAREVCQVNPNVATLLFCGRPLVITELDEICPAILCMWQPGTCGGPAAASLLFGDKVPSGKLTMTWPRSVGQCPIYYNQTSTGRPCYVEEMQKRRAMCSNYLDEYTYPLYPFGYGLSYSSFKYSNIEISSTVFSAGEDIKLSVNVTNKGEYLAEEVVQFYIRDRFSSVCRPVKELKGYQKIILNPNESKKVTFVINEDILSFWREDMSYGVENGEFTLMVGGNSVDLQEAEITLL